MYIKRVRKEYNKQLYAHKFDKFDEVDQFLERHTNYQKSHKEK